MNKHVDNKLGDVIVGGCKLLGWIALAIGVSLLGGCMISIFMSSAPASAHAMHLRDDFVLPAIKVALGFGFMIFVGRAILKK